jgi:hypothetical protein
MGIGPPGGLGRSFGIVPPLMFCCFVPVSGFVFKFAIVARRSRRFGRFVGGIPSPSLVAKNKRRVTKTGPCQLGATNNHVIHFDYEVIRTVLPCLDTTPHGRRLARPQRPCGQVTDFPGPRVLPLAALRRLLRHLVRSSLLPGSDLCQFPWHRMPGIFAEQHRTQTFPVVTAGIVREHSIGPVPRSACASRCHGSPGIRELPTMSSFRIDLRNSCQFSW